MKGIITLKKSYFRTKQVMSYSVTYNDVKIAICRNAFYAIHGITEKRVRTAIKKRTITGTPEPDKRGKHAKHKISDYRYFIFKYVLNA